MSKVYHAYDSKIGRMVCLKILDKAKTAAFEARFTNQGLDKPSEGAVCMALRHPNCVATYEYGVTTQKEPYLVMEWIDGLGLNYLIETKSPQLKGNRVNYLKQLTEADYTWVTEALVASAEHHAQGRIVSMLEGGYALNALGRSVAAHVKVLSGL